jgi:hypothetical protein
MFRPWLSLMHGMWRLFKIIASIAQLQWAAMGGI